MIPHMMRRLSIALGLALLSAIAFAAEKSRTEGTTTFEAAAEQVQSGNGSEAIPALEALARNGDSRAQLLLGAALLNGKIIEQDKARGYAWLQVVITPHRGSSFHAATFARASEVATEAAKALSGSELISADQIALNYVTGRNADWDRSFQRAKDALASGLNSGTDTFDTDFLFAPGCAFDHSLAGCGKVEAAKPHCTGNTVEPDVVATAQGRKAHTIRPVYPGRMPVFDGSVGIHAHVDRSGWICFAKVSDSSGNLKTDRAALEAATRWRLIPAVKDGIAVESFSTWYITLSSK